MTIEFAGKDNEVWNASVFSAKLLTRLELIKGLVLIDFLEFQVDGVLPEGIAIGLVEFKGMFDIARHFNTKHKLDAIDTCLVSLDHGSHAFIILKEFSGPLPMWVFGQMFLNSVGDQRIRVLNWQSIKVNPGVLPIRPNGFDLDVDVFLVMGLELVVSNSDAFPNVSVRVRVHGF